MNDSRNNLTWKWLGGIVLSILLLAGSAFTAYMIGRDSAIEVIASQAHIKASMVEYRLNILEPRLIRIEDKLDEALERRR